MKKTGLLILVLACALPVMAQWTWQIPQPQGNNANVVYVHDYKSGYRSGNETPVITRLEGVGAGERFLEMADQEYYEILSGFNDGEVTYKRGAAPIHVQIVNPLEVKEGVYLVKFVDPTPGDTLSSDTRWILINDSGDTLATADYPISQLNEQYIPGLGISILIGQSDDAGDQVDPTNGTIGYSITYADPGKPQWLSFIPDDAGNVPYTNFIQTELPEYPNYNLDPEGAFSTFAPWVPFILTDTYQDEPLENPLGWNLTPGWMDPAGIAVQFPAFEGTLQSLNNIDIILTADTSKWSRCVVVETANAYYTDTPWLGLPSEGNKHNLQTRAGQSVGKQDTDGDGYPDPDGEIDEIGNPVTGMGWFPGFAVDVETGERLNIFFGENSVYSDFITEALGLSEITHDMIWNPGKQIILDGIQVTPLEAYAGGQQYIYVTRSKYDSCAALRKDLNRTSVTIKARALARVTWCAIPLTVDDPGIDLLPLNEGLIPNDVTIKLRVDNPYQLKEGNGQYNDYPTYRFTLEGTTSIEETLYGESNIMLYPNAATNQVTIESKSAMPGETTINIYGANSTLALNEKFQNQAKMEMDVSSLIPGMYFVEIRTPGRIEVQKLIIQK